MMDLPGSLMNSLADIPGFDRHAFEKVHADGEQVTSIRINPAKQVDLSNAIPDTGNLKLQTSRVPWTKYGYYLSRRPPFTFDPLFHAGCYYVQEASSMFLEQALKQTVDLSKPLKILDLSAAPGGKSTHIQSLMSSDSLLVSNEVIRSRANILKDNIIKWGAGNVIVTSNDPADFAKFKNYFDVIVVDAPCSGSGLFRKEPEAIQEWSENNVVLCSRRQQRILADVLPALKEEGVLIYSTCSYSREEDEEIAEWLLKEFRVSGFELRVDDRWGIIKTQWNNGVGYRFWPDKVEGEGFFISCFIKNNRQEELGKKVEVKAKVGAGTEMLSKKEESIVGGWVSAMDRRYVRHESTVYAWPEKLANEIQHILSKLKVIYSGVCVGELVRDKLIPDHALALSQLIYTSIPRQELDYEQAIRYLKRKDLSINIERKGWQVVTHKMQLMGWINVLSNRINNYYPKELRILKD